MAQIHFRNDFMVQLRRTDAEGNTVPVPSHGWVAVLHTSTNSLYSKVTAHNRDGVVTNAVVKDDSLIFVLDNHGLQPGRLMIEWHEAIPDDAFPDGLRHVHCTYDSGVELVSGMGDAVTKAEVQVQVPYIYRSAYDMAVSNGYEGTMAEYVAAAAKLPTAVETADAVRGSVGVLEETSRSLDATAKALELLSSEYADGRRAIADALTNRDYPTGPTESFSSMARKIEGMSYGAGWLAEIGYSEDNNSIREAVRYARDIAKAWNPDGSTSRIFSNNSRLVFAPWVDTSQATDLSYMFANCSVLAAVPMLDTSQARNMQYMFSKCTALTDIPQIDMSNVTSAMYMFNDCNKLREIPPLDTSRVTSFLGFFYTCNGLEKVHQLDVSGSNTFTECFRSCSKLVYVKLLNVGKATIGTTVDFGILSVWGTGPEENRQSLVDSLVTYSYDRAAAGMATATIHLSANTKALLTDEEIAQITDKGFTIS
ncbi:MAG: BspA family leucine-rich repeat surface protein [Muribaculaceae bacterium]|nr:BspA family leucine-rich repeat surface protein [Muribaculaceae bacterium]